MVAFRSTAYSCRHFQMWRQNAFPGNSDSDHSISDEEDLNGDLGDNCVSLNTSEKEQGLLLQSRLEILRGTDDVGFGRKSGNLTPEDKTNFFAEDEVEMPDFPNESGLIFSQRKESKYHPDEEIISDDEDDYALTKFPIAPSARKLHKDNNLYSFRSEKRDEACTWSMIGKEAEPLIGLNEKSSSSCSVFFKANKSCKGFKGKVKPKFSLHLKSHQDGLYKCFISEDENIMLSEAQAVPEKLEPVEDGAIGNINLEFLEDFQRKNEEPLKRVPSELEAIGNELTEHSMAELLVGLQDRIAPLRGDSEMSRRRREKRAQLNAKNSISPLGDRTIDKEEEPEGVITGSSNDDEANYQNLKNLTNPELKGQTMAERFEEALAATSFSNEEALFTAAKLSGIGLFGKLQQVMQSEKERDADFLKKIQMRGSPNDESNSITVKILSRSLDGKLIVCHCSLHRSGERSQILVDTRRKGTVIFSPRVCSNVDLEVGNLICIHPPWKEVQVMGNDESIILSAYFSHILR